MSTKDIFAVNLSIQLLLLIKTSKPFVTVRNIQTPTQNSLEGTKNRISKEYALNNCWHLWLKVLIAYYIHFGTEKTY
ncbi:hypothetical protein TanjilG_30881 [Lupinus angustifolius]|uniref:Uncharacterized protein n=1 Tax=Lupinus angustifolius TaxID=3871 RepID=A0A394DH57_LUPAN|nr:hypothetical protein TanjilG_30881 [Lupinus angustifolius]